MSLFVCKCFLIPSLPNLSLPNSLRIQIRLSAPKYTGCPSRYSLMVLILYGSSEYDEHTWSVIGNLNCLRHLFDRRVKSEMIVSPKKRPV